VFSNDARGRDWACHDLDVSRGPGVLRIGAWPCLSLGVVLALACVIPSVAAVEAAAARSPICTHGLTTVERDPRRLLPISGRNPIGAATTAALAFERSADRPQVQAALLAVTDHERGPEARYSCGVRVWRRTIVVYIIDRAMLPAQSASQRVYFVGRFANGYHVWQVVD
jgi:hypothetical protein